MKIFSNKRLVVLFLIINILILYFLEGVWINPMIIWISLPIIIGYTIVNKAWKIKSKKKLWEGIMFFLLSLGFSYFYHFTWFLDWQGTRTGSSTAALIFVWGPIWAVVFGYFGYFFGSFVDDNEENL
jgi:membrane protein DedA with SNARE-associated domain